MIGVEKQFSEKLEKMLDYTEARAAKKLKRPLDKLGKAC